MMQKIQIERTTAPKAKPADESKLGFGKIFTDHMYVMEYNPEQGWHDPKIMPYQPIVLDPSAMVFHYGQEMFEGMKAYKCADGRIRLFRPESRTSSVQTTPTEDFASRRSRPMIFSMRSRRSSPLTQIGFRAAPALLFIFVRSSLQRIRSSAYARRTPINSSSFFPRSALTMRAASTL